ncbi:MAG TPA: NAD(P)-binding domain-containing protein [Pseudolysinimonas sp.]|jgi:hypothetical protein
MHIGIIGTGRVGTALGERWIEKGHEVVYGSRTPGVGSVTHAEAAAGADVILTALPGAAVLEALEEVGDENLAGKVILDPSVPLRPDGKLLFPGDSLGRRIQERFPAVHVVKTLNTMNVSMMIDPDEKVALPMVYVSGDDPEAKSTAVNLLTDLGWKADSVLDLGGVETAIGTEHCFYLFFGVVTAIRSPTFTISISMASKL